jgi:hypothetical protein
MNDDQYALTFDANGTLAARSDTVAEGTLPRRRVTPHHEADGGVHSVL